jgi:hypothetical protein
MLKGTQFLVENFLATDLRGTEILSAVLELFYVAIALSGSGGEDNVLLDYFLLF